MFGLPQLYLHISLQSKKVLKASKSDASTATAPETDYVREDSVVAVDERVDDGTFPLLGTAHANEMES